MLNDAFDGIYPVVAGLCCSQVRLGRALQDCQRTLHMRDLPCRTNPQHASS